MKVPPMPGQGFAPEDARSIYIRGYGITSADDQHPVLETHGAGPCLIVAAFNPETRKAGIAHLDANTDPRSINTMLDKLGGGQPLQVYMAGGWEVTRGMVEATRGEIEQRGDAQIKKAEIINPEGTLKGLAIDARTGEVSEEYRRIGITKHPQLPELMGYHATTAQQFMPLRAEYDEGNVPFRPVQLQPATPRASGAGMGM